jgi:hypothetical protein
MDAAKHVVLARRISLAIMALGFTAFYAAWIDRERNDTFRAFNQFEQILAARTVLAERPWTDGSEVTVAALTNIDRKFHFAAFAFSTICQALESGKLKVAQIGGSCESPPIQRKYLLGLTLTDMNKQLPDARVFSLTGLRSQWGADCPAIVFRGRDDEGFWIKGIGGTTGLNEVKGSLIYYVRPSHHCRFSHLQQEPVAFFLIDLRRIRLGWYFYAGEYVLENVLGSLGYRQFTDSFAFNEDLRKARRKDSLFDAVRFFNQFPKPYRMHFVANVPTRFLVLPVTNIESRIIGAAYVKTGVLHTATEINDAISKVYNLDKISPTIGGVATNLRLWISIVPVICLTLSFFFWYHVKRIAGGDSAVAEPWIFIDASGLIEKIFAVLWGALLVLTPATITWALLLNYEASLPTVGQVLFWLGLNRDPLQQLILSESFLSFPATIGGLIIGASAILLFHSLHLLLKARSATYRRVWMLAKSWFVKRVYLAPHIAGRLRRLIASGWNRRTLKPMKSLTERRKR